MILYPYPSDSIKNRNVYSSKKYRNKKNGLPTIFCLRFCKYKSWSKCYPFPKVHETLVFQSFKCLPFISEHLIAKKWCVKEMNKIFWRPFNCPRRRLKERNFLCENTCMVWRKRYVYINLFTQYNGHLAGCNFYFDFNLMNKIANCLKNTKDVLKEDQNRNVLLVREPSTVK